jgi:two-component system response regulator HydG
MSLVLLFSNDHDLAGAVELAVGSVPNCKSHWVRGFAELDTRLFDESACLAILHANGKAGTRRFNATVEKLCSRQPKLATIVICDGFDGELELRYLRMGVRECLTRPLDLRRLTYLIDALTMRSRLQKAEAANSAAEEVELLSGAASPAMRELLNRAGRIAARDISILLGGETGAGKTHLARWIHQHSPRASKPFVSVNCGSLPANLIESELFGHKRGAFTGADEERDGKFAYVKDGTLLLDEIDALPLSSQAKLLRVLDEGMFERIGCNKSLPFRGRLIAASNRTLEVLIERDLFRADLFYRLNVVQFHIPALRERRDEIRPLVRHFVKVLARKHEIAVPAVEHAVWNVLETYDWPGNLRELRNTIEHAVAHCERAAIGLEELPAKFQAAMATRSTQANGRQLSNSKLEQSRNGLARARHDGECQYLLGVLDLCDNNRSQAARALGISRTALYKKLVNFGIT